MLHELQIQDQSSTVLRMIYVWFLRIMALVSIVSGLSYWAQLVGVTNDGALRFDLLEPHWRFLSTALAVVLPAAALGLWFTHAWGVVLWVTAMAMEVAAFYVWSDFYVAKPILVMGHAVTLGFLTVMLIALFIQNKRSRAY